MTKKRSPYSESRYAQYVGQKYACLTLLELIKKVSSKGSTHLYFRAMCDCGTEVQRKCSDVIVGDSVSCGCVSRMKATIPDKSLILHDADQPRILPFEKKKAPPLRYNHVRKKFVEGKGWVKI